jgi:hypothetical protein
LETYVDPSEAGHDRGVADGVLEEVVVVVGSVAVIEDAVVDVEPDVVDELDFVGTIDADELAVEEVSVDEVSVDELVELLLDEEAVVDELTTLLLLLS